MDELFEALRIFEKYMTSDYQKKYPLHCEHDTLYINCDTHPVSMTDEDLAILERNFYYSQDVGAWTSHRFGSC